MYDFPVMPKPTEDLERGSFEWFEGMSQRLKHRVNNVEGYGVTSLLKVVRELFEADLELPWNVFPPPPERPYKRADLYFQEVTGKQWPVIRKMIEVQDEQLAWRIDAHVNPDRWQGEFFGNQYVERSVNNVNTPKPPKEFRKKTVAVVPDVEGIAAVALKHLSDEQRKELKGLL